jgi:hypothetical protein
LGPPGQWEKTEDANGAEAGLGERTKEHDPARDDAEEQEGVYEKLEIVDLGHGPEEVIIVDWLPNDPEVHSLLLKTAGELTTL